MAMEHVDAEREMANMGAMEVDGEEDDLENEFVDTPTTRNLCWGGQRVIYMCKVNDLWVPYCSKDHAGLAKKPDSYCNRYEMNVGFMEADYDEMNENEVTRRVREQVKHRPTSSETTYLNMVASWAYFERFMLEYRPETEFTKNIIEWYRISKEAPIGVRERVRFKVCV
jgi:hypothetical protein